MKKIYVLDDDDQVDVSFEPIILNDGDDPDKAIADWLSDHYADFDVDSDSDNFDSYSECEITGTDNDGVIYDAAHVLTYNNEDAYRARFKLVVE